MREKCNNYYLFFLGVVRVQRELSRDPETYNLTIEATEVTSGLKAHALLLISIEVSLKCKTHITYCTWFSCITLHTLYMNSYANFFLFLSQKHFNSLFEI